MPTSTEERVKLICVKHKSSDSLGKVKSRLLRAMRKAERRSSGITTITHPLQPWTNQCHSLGALPADDVLMTLTNSRYIVFLTKDGRVCRLRCTSRPEVSKQSGDSSVASILNTLRRRGSSAPGQVSFQEESDAEYARQLQAEYEAERDRLLTGGEGVCVCVCMCVCVCVCVCECECVCVCGVLGGGGRGGLVIFLQNVFWSATI